MRPGASVAQHFKAGRLVSCGGKEPSAKLGGTRLERAAQQALAGASLAKAAHVLKAVWRGHKLERLHPKRGLAVFAAVRGIVAAWAGPTLDLALFDGAHQADHGAKHGGITLGLAWAEPELGRQVTTLAVDATIA